MFYRIFSISYFFLFIFTFYYDGSLVIVFFIYIYIVAPFIEMLYLRLDPTSTKRKGCQY